MNDLGYATVEDLALVAVVAFFDLVRQFQDYYMEVQGLIKFW